MNADHTVNVIDIIEIVHIILEDLSIEQPLQWAADMDFSSSINVIDITMLINFIFLP